MTAQEKHDRLPVGKRLSPVPALILAIACTVIAVVAVEGWSGAEDQIDQLESRPLVTVTATVTAKPKPAPTVTVTATPRPTRASRSQVSRPAPSATERRSSSARLDLRHAELWDRIAACESGQRWNSNTGLYDGGLQFLPATWRAWGGTDFAPYAWQATRAEQITVANRSGATNPWLKPWPVCGKRAAAALGYAFP